MSDSEDDKPLAIRAAPALKAPVNGHPAGVLVDDPARRKAAQKAPIIESDSEDDKPLGARAKPVAVKAAARPSNVCLLNPLLTCTSRNMNLVLQGPQRQLPSESRTSR